MSDKSETNQTYIDRIRALTQATRGVWFTYLGVLGFVGITLLGFNDADFFAADRNVSLPLVGVAVPVIPFLFFSATLVTMTYAYLHVTLEPLWATLGHAPARIDRDPLSDVILPWLVSGAALLVRGRARREEPPPVEAGSLSTLGMVTSFTLLFVAAPILVWGLWFRSHTAHLAWLTIAVGFMALGCVLIGLKSFASLRDRMSNRPQRTRRTLTISFLTVAIGLMLAVSLVRTEWDPLGPSVTRYPEDPAVTERVVNWFRPAVAHLSRIRLTEMTPTWRPHDEALRRFRRDWCADIPDPDCRNRGLEDEDLNAAFDAARSREIAVMRSPDLSERHMDHANLLAAFLPGVTLTRTRLRRADMEAAQMEGIRALFVDMTASGLRYARLDGANLRYAKLIGSNMYNLSATNADFLLADMRGANLENADFRHTNLNDVNFEGASLDATRLDGALLERAKFSNANLIETTFERSNLFGADFAYARLRFSRLVDVKLTSAKFLGALVSSTHIEGRADWPVGQPDFTEAVLLGVTFRNLDLSRAHFDQPGQLDQTFADGSVRLPEGMARPCHWSNDVLNDLDYHRHWRGVFEAMPYTPSWSAAVPEAFIDVAPVPLPEDCLIQPFDDEAWRAEERAFYERRRVMNDKLSEEFSSWLWPISSRLSVP